MQTGVASSSEEEKVDSGYDGKEKSVQVTFSIREQAFRVRLGLGRPSHQQQLGATEEVLWPEGKKIERKIQANYDWRVNFVRVCK